jgi:hypothetical protein
MRPECTRSGRRATEPVIAGGRPGVNLQLASNVANASRIPAARTARAGSPRALPHAAYVTPPPITAAARLQYRIDGR